MTQTALDEFVERVRSLRISADRLEVDPNWYNEQYSNHTIVDCTAQDYPGLFSQARHDPRYLAFCKEQDRKEEGRPMPDWLKQWWPALEEARAHDAWNGPQGKQFRAENDLGEMTYPEYLQSIPDQNVQDVEEAQAAMDEGGLISLEEIKGEVGLEVIN